VRARPARYLVVDPGEGLHIRIEARIQEMFGAGWEAEVRALQESVPPAAVAWKATGYDEVRSLISGSSLRDEAVQRIVIDTRQYAKRQRTWFRHQLAGARVTRLDPTAPDALSRAMDWWREEM
jgi:tRNA dimethylallyltransferase